MLTSPVKAGGTDFTETKTDRTGRISSIGGTECDLAPIATFNRHEWDDPAVASRFYDALEAVTSKSQCYHCREVHYAAV